MTSTTMGVSSIAISRRFSAMASATPRSSDSMPGYAAGVSTKTITGRLNFSASLQDAERLSVSLGPRVPEVPVDLLLGVAALLVADDGDGLVVEEREAGDDRRVVAEPAIAVDLGELREQPLDVVQHGTAGSDGGRPARTATA